jgi:hypothetical protein
MRLLSAIFFGIIFCLFDQSVWSGIYNVKVDASNREQRTCLAQSFHLDGFNNSTQQATYLIRSDEQLESFKNEVSICEGKLQQKLNWQIDQQFENSTEMFQQIRQQGLQQLGMAGAEPVAKKFTIAVGKTFRISLERAFPDLNQYGSCKYQSDSLVVEVVNQKISIRSQKTGKHALWARCSQGSMVRKIWFDVI